MITATELDVIYAQHGIKRENVLFLTIYRAILKRIADGTKKVEFRDLTDYYLRKLQYVDKKNQPTGLKPLKYILFKGGYTNTSPMMLIQLVDWYSIEKGYNSGSERSRFIREEAKKDGFTEDDEYIGLILGDIIIQK